LQYTTFAKPPRPVAPPLPVIPAPFLVILRVAPACSQAQGAKEVAESKFELQSFFAVAGFDFCF
jgi:hypothetical protein